MSYRCIEVRQSIWKCVRQTKHSKCIRIYLRIFICIKNSRDTVKQKREWVSEWKKRERCHFYSYDENISHLWANVRLFFVCVKLSSTSEDKIPRRNLHSPPLSFVHSLQWHVCLCSFGTKRSCFSFTTATDVFCFFLEFIFCSPLSNEQREKKRRMGNSAVFARIVSWIWVCHITINIFFDSHIHFFPCSRRCYAKFLV